MKLLILGGTGVISRAIVRQALNRGFEVTTVNRGTRNLDMPRDVRTVVADRFNQQEFAEKLKQEQPDAVIDMICFTPDDARQTMSIFRNKAKHIIFTSSVAAYERPYKSLPTREDAETLSQQSEFYYSIQKANMERYLQGEMGKSATAVTIIRPSLTFGPGARNFGILRQNYNVVQRIKSGRPLVMVGETMLPWTFTDVEDLANGFVLACGNVNTFNDHFQVLNNEVVVWEDLYRTLGEVLGKDVILNYIPSVLLKDVDEKLTGHLYYEKVYCSVFSIDKFQKAVPEYVPAYSYKDCITRLVASWEEEGLAVDPEKDALEDGLCAAYDAFRKQLVGLKRDMPYAFAFK